MTPNWKLERIKSLDDEVKEVHPVLKELFRNIPYVTEVNYTQGNREMGADFVLTKYDDNLLEQDYIGVIVKSTTIKQNHDDVRRQIRECEQARPIEGGKKEIYLTEVWIVTSKDITRSAKDSIHHEYKNARIKFFDAEKIVKLIDLHYPKYWDFANFNLSNYLTKQIKTLDDYEATHSLVPGQNGRIEFTQQIVKTPAASKRKFNRKLGTPTTLVSELTKNRFLYIEGSMGAGKSELLRATAKKLCDPQTIRDLKLIPYFTTFREVRDNPESLTDILVKIRRDLDDAGETIALFVDGLDETAEDMDAKIDFICAQAAQLSSDIKVKLIVTSRIIQQENIQSKIAKHFDRYNVCPLSHSVIISFIEQICSDLKITAKFKNDLQNSPLMRALPRTPLSAILLGRILSDHVKELPSTLPELYSKFTELVLGRWDIKKGNGSEKEYETIQRIISFVAGYMIENDFEYLGIGELDAIFDDYLKQRRTGQDKETLLKAFIGKNEIIGCDRDKGAIFFKHKTFKEFFYATMQYQQKGLNAPIKQPFDPYWQGIEYFYLGIVRDAPSRIESLSKISPVNDMESLVKISAISDFLLAAYQTPYKQVEGALNHAFLDAANLYVDIVYNKKDSWLNNFPELQLLCLMTKVITSSYGYDFFLPALHESKLLAELDQSLSEDQRNVLIFFIDSVLASLGDEHAFKSLVDEHQKSLSWALKLGIDFSAQDAEFINTATKAMIKKISKSVKGNHNLQQFIMDIQDKPMKDRKNLGSDRQ